MALKLLILVILAILFVLPYEAAAKSITCKFKVKTLPINFRGSIKDYACEIQSFDLDGPGSQFEVKGDHIAGKKDSDVKILEFEDPLNQKSVPTFNINFCQKFPNLKAIKITFWHIELIDPTSLENCRNLINLDFHFNKNTEIEQDLFTKLRKLTHLSFEDNQITSISDKAFVNQKELNTLDLSYNKLSSLPSNVFGSLEKLRVLNLVSNLFENLDSNLFQNLRNLEDFDFSANKISIIHADTFQSLVRLKKLRLWMNEIKTLESNAFNNLENLEILGLHTNQISDLPPQIFTPLKNLKELQMSKNQLSTIDSKSFGIHRKLTAVDFGFNKIDKIDEKFIENTAVSDLKMSQNICTQNHITRRNEMKQELQKCIENFNAE